MLDHETRFGLAFVNQQSWVLDIRRQIKDDGRLIILSWTMALSPNNCSKLFTKQSTQAKK
jgi:hypothetical protein